MFGEVTAEKTSFEVEAESEWRALVFTKAEKGLVPLSVLQERVEELSREGREERADALLKFASSCRS